jgi:hypothetical protein
MRSRNTAACSSGKVISSPATWIKVMLEHGFTQVSGSYGRDSTGVTGTRAADGIAVAMGHLRGSG